MFGNLAIDIPVLFALTSLIGMALSIRVSKSAVEGSTTVATNNTHTVDNVVKLEEVVPDSTTDEEHAIAIDISNLQVFMMVATVAMTVKTNSSGSPDDTFNLTANAAVLFETGDTAIFTADVTSIFVSNSSGSSGTLQILSGVEVS